MSNFIRRRLFGKFDEVFVLSQPPVIPIKYNKKLSCSKMNVYSLTNHPNIGFVYLTNQGKSNHLPQSRHLQHTALK